MSAAKTPLERHYTTAEAREILGLAHEREVVKAIKDKKIFARKRVARGTGAKPRWIIPQSELRRVLEAGGNNLEDAAPAAPRSPTGEASPRTRPRRRSGKRNQDWVD